MACMVSSSDDGGREGVCTVERLRRSEYKIERKEAEKENMLAAVIKKASDIMIGVGDGRHCA
jgi:hypothetical protein